MALSVLKSIIRIPQLQLRPVLSRSYSLWEPPYLKCYESKIPLYPALNFEITGYDFTVVEKAQKYIHKLANQMNLDVDNSWAMPPKQLHIKNLKPHSNIVECEYYLNVYQRNVQFSNIMSTFLPIFVRAIEASLPPGVTLVIENCDPLKESVRYVPDVELLDLKKELTEMDNKD